VSTLPGADRPRDGAGEPDSGGTAGLHALLDGLPFGDDDIVVAAQSGDLSLGELRSRAASLAVSLREAGVRPGQLVGNLVHPGPSSLVVMFATWAADAVYLPINARLTTAEISAWITETPVALVIGSAADLAASGLAGGAVEYDHASAAALIRVPADAAAAAYDGDVALMLRTSGTTGRPKAVLLRHSGTLEALDASIRKLRGPAPGAPRARRFNLIPVSLALWAGVFNTLFAFRAGFAVVLLDTFTPAGFAAAVAKYALRSVVLAPAMIAMVSDAEDVTDLGPLRLVRSITAPLSPEVARRFHQRFGVFVLNSYGQTELGGEVVGWTAADVREFGERKLGAAGRAYDGIDLQVRGEDGRTRPAGEPGEIYVRSPFRMHGYAVAGGATGPGEEAGEDRCVDGYLRTGDVGRVDHDGFLWVQGRVSDMINRGGLKIHPDEVEEALREHPRVSDAGVAGVPDRRLGEVPHAWVVTAGDVAAAELEAWCRERVAPYKVPVAFTRVPVLPRSDIGKLLRRDLVRGLAPGAGG